MLWIMLGATPCLPFLLSFGPQQAHADGPGEAIPWTNTNVPPSARVVEGYRGLEYLGGCLGQQDWDLSRMGISKRGSVRADGILLSSAEREVEDMVSWLATMATHHARRNGGRGCPGRVVLLINICCSISSST